MKHIPLYSLIVLIISGALFFVPTIFVNRFTTTPSLWIQKGICFVAFDSEQKSIYWDERMNEILSFKWDEKEREHLENQNFAILNRSYWFDVDNRDDIMEEDMSLFAFKWIDYAREELLWDDQLIYAIVGSGNKMLNKSGELHIISESSHDRLKNGTERACNCNQKYDFCSNPEPDCLDNECDEKPFCGRFHLSKCNCLCG